MTLNYSTRLTNIYRMLVMGAVVTLACTAGHAQKRNKPDSLAPIRILMQICQSAQQGPLHAQMAVYNSTDFITAEEDTAVLQAEFFINGGLSYLRFGEVEQLSNDSVSLVISDKYKKMFLSASPSHRNVTAGMDLFNNTTVVSLGEKFTSSVKEAKDDTTRIVLISRLQIMTTTLPVSQLEMQYDPRTKQPWRIITTARTLVPIAADDYAAMKSQPGMEGRLLSVQEKSFYIIKEQSTTYEYKILEHDAGIRIPVTVADRVTQSDHETVPVKSYAGYRLTIN